MHDPGGGGDGGGDPRGDGGDPPGDGDGIAAAHGASAADGTVVADLHVHTTASDGSIDVDEVPAAARRAGVDVVAVTDHDRVHPGLDAPVVERDGVTVVRGVELRVETDAERVDLLGYAVDPTPELTAELDRLQRDRVERGRRVVENVEAHLGVDLDVEVREGLGRPHVARAVEAADVGYTYGDAFAELIGDGGPCFVARDVTDVSRGLSLLDDAAALVAVAHPLRYDDPAAALALCADPAVDAVERYYAYGRPVDPAPVDAAIAAHGLLATGGSDAHDDRLGVAGLDATAFDPVRERLGL
jgi:predicted metal-dependent phosphoesterase TrpH